jgi:hypothetical protein
MIMKNKEKNAENKKEIIRSNHTPRGNAIFSDEVLYNEPIKLSILRLEHKKRELLQKYRETEYYKSGKDKRNKSPKE